MICAGHNWWITFDLSLIGWMRPYVIPQLSAIAAGGIGAAPQTASLDLVGCLPVCLSIRLPTC